MNNAGIEFVRTGTAPIENLRSFVLEVYIENKLIAGVFCAGTSWRVRMSTLEGLVEIPWEDFLKFIYEFSKFVSQESEILLNKKDTNFQDDE